MVERREYESYIRKSIEKILRKVPSTYWDIVKQVREYANSNIRIRDLEELIVKQSPDSLDIKKYINDNKLKTLIKIIYENIITLSEQNKKVTTEWLDEQCVIITNELIGLDDSDISKVATKIKSDIIKFASDYLSTSSKMEKDKNDLIVLIIKEMQQRKYSNENEVRENVLSIIEEKYPSIFLNGTPTEEKMVLINQIIKSISLDPVIEIPASLPNLLPLKQYTSDDIVFAELVEKKFNNSKMKSYIIDIYSKYNSSEVIRSIIGEIRAIEDNEGINIAGNECKNKLLSSETITNLINKGYNITNEEIKRIISIYIKYKDDYRLLTKKAFICELIFEESKKIINELYRANFKNLTNIQKTNIESCLRDFIKEYYEKITERKTTIQIDEAACRQLIYAELIKTITPQKSFIKSININNEETIRTSVDKIFSGIIHVSANDPLEVIRYPNQGIVQINGIFLPLEFLTEFLKEHRQVLKNAMRNSNLFMSDYYSLYFDDENHKYLIPNDDVHSYGLSRGELGEKVLFDYLIDYSKTINLEESRTIKNNRLNQILFYYSQRSIECDQELKNSMSDYDESNNLKSLEERCVGYDRAQSILKKLIIPQNNTEKVMLLTYFVSINKDNGLSIENVKKILLNNRYYFGNGFIESFKGKPAQNIFNDIIRNLKNLNNNLIKYKYDMLFELQDLLQQKQQILGLELIKSVTLTEEEIESGDYTKIKKQFKSDIEHMEIVKEREATLLKQVVNGKETIFTIKPTEHENIFEISEGNCIICKIKNTTDQGIEILEKLDEENYILETTNYGTINIIKRPYTNSIYSFGMDANNGVVLATQELRKASWFAIIQTYIEEHAKKFDSFITSDQTKYTGPVNVMKVYDKLIYYNNFNFILDLENIYMTDMKSYIINYKQKNPRKEIGLIAEISSANERALVLYEQEINQIMRFVSLQGASELNMISSTSSYDQRLAEFEGLKYKTIIGLEKTNQTDDLFYSTHTELAKKKIKIEDFIQQLIDGHLVFRCATSCEAETIKDKKKKLIHSTEINVIDIVDRTLKGMSNALLWIQGLNSEKIESFIGTKKLKRLNKFFDKEETVNNEQINIIKTLFFKQLHHDILEIMDFLIEYKKNICDDNVKSAIDERIDKCCRYSQTEISNQNNIESSLKEMSIEWIVSSILKDENFIAKISNPNIFENEKFEKLLKIIALYLPDYVLDILSQKIKEKGIVNPRIESITELIWDIEHIHNRPVEELFKIFLGDSDDRLIILQEIEDNIRRIENYSSLSLMNYGTNNSHNVKTIGIDLELNKELIKLLKQKKSILESKTAELSEQETFGEFLKDGISNKKRKNILINEAINLEVQISEIEEYIESIEVLNKFLKIPVSEVKAEDLDKLIEKFWNLKDCCHIVSDSINNKLEEIFNARKDEYDLIEKINDTKKSLEFAFELREIFEEIRGHHEELIYCKCEVLKGDKDAFQKEQSLLNPEIKELLEEYNVAYTKYEWQLMGGIYSQAILPKLKLLPESTQKQYFDLIQKSIRQMEERSQIETTDICDRIKNYYMLSNKIVIKDQLKKINELCQKIVSGNYNDEHSSIKSSIEQLDGDYNSLNDSLSFTIVRALSTIDGLQQEYLDALTNYAPYVDTSSKANEADNIYRELKYSIIEKTIDILLKKIKSKIHLMFMSTNSNYYIAPETTKIANRILQNYYNQLMNLAETCIIEQNYELFKNREDLEKYYELIKVKFHTLSNSLQILHNTTGSIIDPTTVDDFDYGGSPHSKK